jgi:hypothetical protein
MADENDNTDTARLRQIVREEIARSSDINNRNPVRLSTQSVNERTQQLIRGAANTTANELSSQIQPRGPLPFSTSTTVPTQGACAPSIQESRSSAGKCKSQPGHPWRFKAASAPKRKVVEGKSIHVWLLDYPIENSGNDYALDDSMVMLKV